MVQVDVALKVSTIEESLVPVYGTAEIGSGQEGEVEINEVLLTLNGVEATEQELLAQQQEQMEQVQLLRKQRDLETAGLIGVLADRHALAGLPELQVAAAESRPSFTLALTAEQVLELAEASGDLLDGIDLHVEPVDDIAGAMLDTRVDPWAIDYNGRQGENIGIYMTESGCPMESRLSNYDRLAGSETNHSRNVSGILRAVSPDSYIYCRGGATLPTSGDLDGVGDNPPIHVVNRSNGADVNGLYNTTARDWDNLVYNEAVAVHLSAGNVGTNSTCQSTNMAVGSPAMSLNSVTVGNYDDSNDTISSTSCTGDPTNTKNDKPELSAPGTSITAGGFTMSGTSMAAPHAAGIAADLMSAYSWLRFKPYYIKAFMLAGATKPISGGFDAVGLGGTDFYSMYYGGTNSWYQGSNGSFSYFDSNDAYPNNNYIDRTVYLSSSLSSVRVVVAWLNRGTYTYNNRNDAHPIGMDLDVRIYDPNGKWVGGSYSWDNPFEDITFDPKVSGTYRIAINRYANRDTSSKFHMGVSVQW